MEARTKQQQLLFDKGITNVPSDNLCSDNTLAESVGMVYEDGEHRVIQRPVEFITSAVAIGGTAMDIPVIVYIHSFDNEERFIGHIQSGNNRHLCWGIVESGVFALKEMFMPNNAALYYEPGMSFDSVGKVLTITIPNKPIQYFVYKPNKYDYYSDILAPDISFKLTDYEVKKNGTKSYRSLIFDTNGAWGDARGESRQHGVAVGKQAEFNDIILGAYYTLVKNASRKKAFSRPFLVRYALEMYDGSYYHISQPIAMFPSVTRNCWLQNIDADEVSYSTDEFKMYLKACLLWYKSNIDLSDFSDLVKNVSIFVSNEIEINDVVSDQYLDNVTSGLKYDTISEAHDSSVADQSTYRYNQGTEDVDHPERTAWRAVREREIHSVMEDIASASAFFKLAEIGLTETEEFKTFDFDEHKIENITTQEYIEEDDYYSRCQMHPLFQYAYNSRLNLANVTRGFFEGFDFFMPYDNVSANTYTAYVKIVTDGGDYWIEHQYVTKQKQGIYFYYPDSRATHVTIFKGSDCVCDAELTEHTGLNGAYYLNKYPISYSGHNLPSFVDETVVGSVTSDFHPNNHQNNNGDTENLPNYIIQSEVDNPWVFKANGYFKVGTGKIIGMSSITQALSEGQFGSYPLLVFSESGIWALSVADTGYYSSIHPMSREVCNNARSITQTDGAVFFTSEKGLMVIVGNQVKCVSEQLSGKQDLYSDAMFPSSVIGNVSNFFRTCYIAYDYRDSLLWIMGNAPGAEHCYIYSIKSGTFSKYHLPQLPRGCVNYYPDYLIQTNPSGKVYSLLQRPNINLDYVGETTNPRQYTATMLTRPMKMENALALKSIMHLKNIKLFSPYTITTTETDPETQEPVSVETPYKGSITFRLFASNNLENWVELPSLRGTPWKYYRFRFDFADLIATDRFAGTVVVTQERRTDKIR